MSFISARRGILRCGKVAGNADKFSRFSNDVDSVDGLGDELCAFYLAYHKQRNSSVRGMKDE